MRFEVKAKVGKTIWNSSDAWLYEVFEVASEKTKKWAIFCRQQLMPEQVYFFSGEVSNSKTKKLDINNKPIWGNSFNADSIKEEGANEDFTF